jgi:hypothetical protein
VLWPFGLNGDGYARIQEVGTRRTRRAHQVVLEIAGFARPSLDHEVRHLCGVRACVNLIHLRWGTKSENQRDRFRVHGDHQRGERNAHHKLTAADVTAIRSRYSAGERASALAVEFGCSPSNISMITTGRTWAEGAAA